MNEITCFIEKAVFIQDADSVQEGEDVQELVVSIQSSDLTPETSFIVIQTERWAVNSAEELQRIVNAVMTAQQEITNQVNTIKETKDGNIQ
jgi:hypothetical protein